MFHKLKMKDRLPCDYVVIDTTIKLPLCFIFTNFLFIYYFTLFEPNSLLSLHSLPFENNNNSNVVTESVKMLLQKVDFQYFYMNVRISYDKPRVKLLRIFEKLKILNLHKTK